MAAELPKISNEVAVTVSDLQNKKLGKITLNSNTKNYFSILTALQDDIVLNKLPLCVKNI